MFFYPTDIDSETQIFYLSIDKELTEKKMYVTITKNVDQFNKIFCQF